MSARTVRTARARKASRAIGAFGLAPALLFMATAANQAGVSEARRRWQGNWLVLNAEYEGSVQAWRVQGSSVTVYDPVAHRSEPQQVTFESPCRLVRKESIDSGEGQTVSTTNTFAFASDGLHVAPAEAAGGERQGATLTACVGDHVYTYDTATRACQKWNETMTGMPSPASECALDANPPSLVFRQLGLGTSDLRLDLRGDALLSPALAAQVAQREPSFAAACRHADALLPR